MPTLSHQVADWSVCLTVSNQQLLMVAYSPGAKLENGGLPYTESPLSFDGFN